MSAKLPSKRDPYPFPKLENDDDFTKSHKLSQKLAYGVPTHVAQNQAPFGRLYKTATLSSSRREAQYYDPKAPNDNLDFVLKTKYNQHNEFLKGRSDAVLQPETLGDNHGRVLKNRTIHISPTEPKLGHPLRITQNPRREDVNCNAFIAGTHTQTTNNGFSRKPDGGFFTS